MTTEMLKPVLLDASGFGIDPAYQRQPEERRSFLQKVIADNFDPAQFDVIHVTQRNNGSYVIIDGAGRCYAYYVLMGQVGKVTCMVHPKMSIADEAKLFVNLNRNRRAVNSGDMFKAEVASKDKTAVVIQGCFTRLGMTVGRKSGTANIASIQSVKSIHNRFDNLERTLAIKKNVWPEHVCGGGLLESLSLFLAAVPNIDEVGFRKVLQANLPDTILASLKARGGTRMPLKRYIPLWAAEFLAEEYNHRRKKQRADLNAIRRLAALRGDDEDEAEAA